MSPAANRSRKPNSTLRRIGPAPGVWSGASLAECHRQQARAQEHEAGCRQGKKTAGDDVVVAHDTPATRDSRANLLKLSESLLSQIFQSPAVPRPPDVQNSRPVTIAFKCVSNKNACAHQAHQCCNRLDHRTNPYAPLHPQNDCRLAQSKRFTEGFAEGA